MPSRHAAVWRSVVFAVLLGISTALPPHQIKASGERTSAAIMKDLGQGIKLLEQLHTLAVQGHFHDAHGKAKTFPELHKSVEKEIEKVYSSEEGSGGIYAGYFADEEGRMNGVLVPNNRYHVWIGHPPSDSKLTCLDPHQRSSCSHPAGTRQGYLETFEMHEDTDHYQTAGLFQNVSYDPRVHQWYQPQAHDHHRISRPYLFKPDAYSSSIGLTLSRAVRRDGKVIGVVGVDVDLSSLDMILGPLRPAAGSEAVLADPVDGSIIVSTFTASRQVRWTHKKMSCFDQPFLHIFGHIVNTVGNLRRAAEAGTILLHANEGSKLLRWNSICSVPIHIGDGQTWLLVVTDDSENRAESGSQAAICFGTLLAAALCALLQ